MSTNELANPESSSDLAASSTDEILEPGAFPIVGVGASAGGLAAFSQLLAHLPVDTGVALVLIQHLDPTHESRLADLLSRVTRMPVREATDGMEVRPNQVHVIPPNTNLAISQGVLRITPREGRGQHLPLDFFFRSLADDQRASAIGVILSGTGSDGTLGLAEIKAAGGLTFAQDKESAKFDGMPISAIASGAVDFVLPPQEIARELARVGHHPYLARLPRAELGHQSPRDDESFRKIIVLLRSAFGVDFTHYRETTLLRRTMRRMALLSLETFAEYAQMLAVDQAELQALYHDILISVTSFFRDAEMFEVLKTRILPEIVGSKSQGTPIRVWAAGCSTGQEAYSLAMVLLEFLEEKTVRPSIQIFATDLSETVALGKARAGLYPGSIEAEVSPERLRRFFVREGDDYRISKSIRDLCVFAKQNIVADPPFSRLDLISCRNVLIYLAPPLQRKVIPTFHYALNPAGFLMLGASETIGAFGDLFAVVDKTHKIYARKPTSFRQYPHFSSATPTTAAPGEPEGDKPSTPTPADLQKEADRIVLGEYAPAGVLVDDSFEILQFRGRTSPYLEPAPGTASLSLVRMAREGLGLELRAALAEAKNENKTALRQGVRIRDDGQTRAVDLKVIPLKLSGMSDRGFLVLFEESAPAAGQGQTAEPSGPARQGSWIKGLFAPSQAARTPAARPTERDDREIAELRRELTAAREEQQAIIEEQEAANEELKSANEEVLSSNEELQSTNEELETAKEELQSVNEELTTVNEQLQNRNAELNRLNDDLANLLSSGNVPMVLVGVDLRIRRFTATAGKALNLIPTDVGRPIGDLRPPVEVPDLEELLSEVIETVRVAEREVRDSKGHWYQLRLHPYRTSDNKIDGAVIVLLDIDLAKNAQALLKESSDYTRAIVQTVREPLLILDGDLRVKSANQAFYENLKVTPAETEGQLIHDLGDGQWDIPPLRVLLEDVLLRDASFENFEVAHEFPRIGERVMLLNARKLVHDNGATRLILLAFQDITERRRAEAHVLASELRYRRLFESARDGILMLDPNSRKIIDVNQFMMELLNYSRDEFLGKELWEIGLLQDEQASQAAFDELRDKGYVRYDGLPLETKWGEPREVEVVGNLYWENGHQVIQCNIRDVSERKRAEKLLRLSEERYQSIVTQVTAGIAQTDFSGRFVLVNQRFCEIVGYSQEELCQMQMHDITHPDDLPRNAALFQSLVDGGPDFMIEKRYLHKDGFYVWVNNSVSTIRDHAGQPRGLVAVVIDVTRQKQAEQTLKDADRRKNEFLAILAHELRNPLAAVHAAVLLLRAQGHQDEDQTWVRDLIDRQVHLLTRLTDDLLDVSRISSGKIQLKREDLDVKDVLARAVESVRPLINTKHHELVVSLPAEPLPVHADPVRLEQVVVNLLTNAAKYTDPGGRITLASQLDRETVVITVRDTGVGVPAEMITQIFEIFTQVDSSLGRSQGGLGIGLTLVKRLVELHGGSISAVSPGPGMGSEFTIRLPAAAPHPTNPLARPPGESNARQLPAEDDNQNAPRDLDETREPSTID